MTGFHAALPRDGAGAARRDLTAAVDPVRDGAKVTAQAAALGWPAVLRTDDLSPGALDRWWRWCLSADGRTAATRVAATMSFDENIHRNAILAALTQVAPKELL